jgi:hypothetical protein
VQRLLRFRLRTIFLAIAAVGCFLAWRLRDPERPAVRAIAQAGGQVHYGFQEPSPSFSFISFAMLPECIYFSQIQVKDHGPTKPPPGGVRELFLGNPDHCVSIVELQLEHMSPEMIDHLKSLAHLRFIVLDMPQGIIAKDSDEGRRLRELEKEFGGKLFPAYNRGFAFADPDPREN